MGKRAKKIVCVIIETEFNIIEFNNISMFKKFKIKYI